MAKISRSARQNWARPIFVGHQRLVDRHWPRDVESGIVPQQAAMLLVLIMGAYLVDDSGIRLQLAIPMANPSGMKIRFQLAALSTAATWRPKLGEPSVCRPQHRRSTPPSRAAAWLGETAESGSEVRELPACSPTRSGCHIRSESLFHLLVVWFFYKLQKRLSRICTANRFIAVTASGAGLSMKRPSAPLSSRFAGFIPCGLDLIRNGCCFIRSSRKENILKASTTKLSCLEHRTTPRASRTMRLRGRIFLGHTTPGCVRVAPPACGAI